MSDNTPPVASRNALFFDFDNLVLGARSLYYDALAEVIKSKGAALTPILFSRFFVDDQGQSLPALYGELGLDPADAAGILDQIRETVHPRIAASNSRPSTELQTWLDAARARGATLFAVTSLSTPEAEALYARIGLSTDLVRVCPMPSLSLPESWTSAAGNKNPRRCIAILTDAAAVHAAIAAKFAVIAVPDSYTDYQDFCGADLICTKLKDVKADDYLQTIRF